jgi:lipopolysaccharide transport system permease protein
MFAMLSGAWRYRYFILSSIKTEFRARFVRSRLGALWMILHPLAQVLIFAFVLSAVLSTKLPGIESRYGYAIYLMAGILAWSLFAEIINRSLTLFIDNGNLLKKIVFPRMALPLIVTGSAVVNNALLLLSIFLIFGALGHPPEVALVWLPIVMLVNIGLALGCGLALGVLNVFVRDIGQAIPVAMQFLFWFTPIVYMPHIIPEPYREWLVLNPLVPVIGAYQDILVYGRAPNWFGLAIIGVLAGASLAFALLLFRKASPEMVDVL